MLSAIGSPDRASPTKLPTMTGTANRYETDRSGPTT